MFKTIVVLVFSGLVFGALYLAWLKVVRPLRMMAVDNELRIELERLVREDLIPFITAIPDYNEASRKEIRKHHRFLVESISDKVFDNVVIHMSQDQESKDRFYNDTNPEVSDWLEEQLASQLVAIASPTGTYTFEEDIHIAVIKTYLEFSEFATNHPEARAWTAFGFMSWVNLNIDQILEDLLNGEYCVE